MSVRALRRGAIAASRAQGTLTTYTLYPSLDGTVYAPLAAADGGGSGVTLAGTELTVGWSNVTGYESFLAFNTSTVAGTITAATLHLYGSYDGSATDFTIEARAYDWGATLTTADWRSPGSLGGLTLLASRSTAGFTTSGYNAFTSQPAFLSNINQSGTTRLIVNSDAHRTGGSGGDRFVVLVGSGSAGTTQDPKLVIEALV